MGSGSSKPSTAPTLYSFPISPPCRAVLMTAEVARINLTIEHIDLVKQEQNGEAFKAINPDHTLPTLVDGSLTLWESRAIQQYLLDRYAPDHSLYPRDPVKRAAIDRIIQYDIGNFAPAVIEYVRPQLLLKQPADPEKQKTVEKVLDYIEKLLEKSKHLCSDQISIADLSVLAYVTFLELISWNFVKWPKVHTWMKSLQGQSWYKKVNKPLEDFKAKASEGEPSKNEE